MPRIASIERAVEVRRVEVEQAHPIDAVGHLAHERHEPAVAHALVAAVGGQVLGDEHDLAHAGRHEAVDLVEQLGRGRVTRCGPRKLGMAQKPHALSQPSATFT